MRFCNEFRVLGHTLSPRHPTYFIADIASSHDGELSRAKELIWHAKEAGADCVKFQHFKAERIVSDRGFRDLGSQASHQATWKKSVFEVFKKYEFNRDWNFILAEESKKAAIHFMTTPYDFEAVEEIDPLVSAYKIGSGDITWTAFLSYLAKKKKPLFLATGASTLEDVSRAIDAITPINTAVSIMQCNTNYTGSLENFKYVNLSVLRLFAEKFPGALLGLSDHTPGHSTVLGAVALGARVIEKHFTDDNHREGPDHGFSMNPKSWREMVDRSRELEASLGDGLKRVEQNEKETVVLQRRCLRAARPLKKGHFLTAQDLEALRPAPEGALPPYTLDACIGKALTKDLDFGEAITPSDLQ